MDTDPTELGRNRTPDAGIAADTAQSSAILADGVKTAATEREAWLGAPPRSGAGLVGRARPRSIGSAPVHHFRLGAELDRVLDPDTIVIGDGGDVVAPCRASCASTAGPLAGSRARSAASASARRTRSA